MSKKVRRPSAPARHPAGSLSANGNTPGPRAHGGSTPPTAPETSVLSIELLEERLAPAYPVCGGKKTAGWGC
jgi:hypothetical protein